MQDKKDTMMEKLTDSRRFYDKRFRDPDVHALNQGELFLYLMQYAEETMRYEVLGGITFSDSVDPEVYQIFRKPDYFTKYLD